MAWIELHNTLRNHRKIYALMSILGVTKPHAVGILSLLWTWALDAAEDGDLSGFPPRAIADAVEWRKSPDKLVEALVASGWLDRDEEGVLVIHDWYDFAGRLIERREEERAYKKRRYALYGNMRLTKAIKARDGDRCRYCGKVVNWNDKKGLTGGTYDHVDPNGDNSEENVVVACRSCNSKKKDRTPAEAGMILLPAPIDSSQISDKYQANNGQIKSAITVPHQTVPLDFVVDDESSSIGQGAYLKDLNDYTGMTDENKQRIAQITRELFAKHATRAPGEQDIIHAFHHLTDSVHSQNDNTWHIEFPDSKRDLLGYAFEQSTLAGCPANWNYINGVLNRLHQRGIKDLQSAQEYDCERDMQRGLV